MDGSSHGEGHGLLFLLARVVERITINCFVMLLDLVSDVSGQIEISLDAVSDLGEDVLCLFEWVVSVYDDTSDILTTLTVEEEGSTVSTSELATVRSRSVSVVPCEARLGARDHPLRPEQHLVHILLGASHTCLIDEGSSLCESVV